MIDLARIATQLIGRHVYVVLASDGIPPGLVPSDCDGCTHRRLDVVLREWLQSRGLWRGRNPAVYVNDTGGKVEAFLAVLLHELAHVVDHGVDDAELCDASERFTVSCFRSRVSTELTPAEVSRQQTPLHSQSFARLCCHLHFRAMQTGCRCPLDWLYDGPLYGIPHVDDCMSALNNEPESLAYVPILAVADITPPRPFRELFQSQEAV